MSKQHEDAKQQARIRDWADARKLSEEAVGPHQSPAESAEYHADEAEKSDVNRNTRAHVRACTQAVREAGYSSRAAAAGRRAAKAMRNAIDGLTKAQVANSEMVLLMALEAAQEAEIAAAAADAEDPSQAGMRKAIANVRNPQLRAALLIVAEAGFASDAMDEDRNEVSWPVYADGDTDTCIAISLQQF